MVGITPTTGPRLFDVVRDKCRLLHFSVRTEEAYVGWIRRFIAFHEPFHPRDMDRTHIEAFLTHLAVERRVAASTQNQAFSALLFLFQKVYGRELPTVVALRVKRPARLPTVLSHAEVRQILAAMTGVPLLIAQLMYGARFRVLEVCRLRVKDLDFDRRQILVRRGKGDIDRAVPLPESLERRLREQVVATKVLHERDLRRGDGRVWLPEALAAKYPAAETEFGWQYLFPSNRLSADPRAADGLPLRHHLHENSIQKQVTATVRGLGLVKRVSCHTLRHSFATPCWRPAATSAPCRNSSATPTCARR